jgi:hypothetical protein
MFMALLPWIGVVVFSAGCLAALSVIAYAALVSLVGYLFVSAALPTEARPGAFVLAPSAGILALSAVTSFWVRLGLPLVWVSVVWLGLTAAGALAASKDGGLWKEATINYGMALVVLSVLICGIYFTPGAFNDAISRPDGSFNWLYVDTQHLHSMVTSIKTSDHSPRMAGTATAELIYHFGAYSLPAALSRFTGLNAGDAYARVTRGVAQWALVFSCYGLGILLSLRATGKAFGGIMSVAGLFFYGSALSLFAEQRNSSSLISTPILFSIPGVDVLADGGPFAHLILGHSMLHGMGALTAIMALCLAHMEMENTSLWRTFMLLILPALMVSVNSVGGLYSLGVVGILLFWGVIRKVRSWILAALMFGLFLGAWSIMGYSHAPHGSGATLRPEPASQWWPVLVWFFVGLGFRIFAFRWVSQPMSNPVAMLVLVTFLGLLSFSVLIELYHSNERYGIYFLQALFSIFAFSRFPLDFWRRDERVKWVADWMETAKKGLLIFIVSGIAIAIAGYAIRHASGISYFRPRMFECLAGLFLLVILLTLMKRVPSFSSGASAVVASVLLLGFSGWIAPWINFGLGRQKMDVTLTPGEVQGLKRFHDLSKSGERFATDKHLVPSLPMNPERSYAYGALSERPVLIEGYKDAGEIFLPNFTNMLSNNDLLFTTTNSDELRRIAKTYDVQWLVARPGTDISLARPLPSWLVEQKDAGDLKIYRIN